MFVHAKEAGFASMTFTARLPSIFFDSLAKHRDADLLIVIGLDFNIQLLHHCFRQLCGVAARFFPVVFRLAQGLSRIAPYKLLTTALAYY